LLTPASDWLMNDSYGNDVNIQRKLGEPSVHLNPDDAAALGLDAGSTACLSNETGRLERRVSVSDRVARGVALAHKGRWPKVDGGDANVNVLNPGTRSDMGDSSSVHGTIVRITPAER
jgi:anaerobic selenocysteine-containing dehydrogenase